MSRGGRPFVTPEDAAGSVPFRWNPGSSGPFTSSSRVTYASEMLPGGCPLTSSGRSTCPCHCPWSQDGDLYGAWCPFPLSPSLDSWFRTPQVRLDSPQASGDGARAVRGRSRSVERLRPAVLDARHTAVPPAGGSCPALRPDPGRCVRDLLEASGLSPGLPLPAVLPRASPGCGSWRACTAYPAVTGGTML